MTRILTLAALSAAALVTTPAFAEEHVWQTGAGFTVRTDGLDLARMDHRARLLRRVEDASARICRDQGARSLRQACAETVVGQALAAAPISLRPVLARAIQERDGMAVASR